MSPFDLSYLCAWSGLARRALIRYCDPVPVERPACRTRRRSLDRLGRVLVAGGIALHDFGRWLARDDFRLGRTLPGKHLRP